MEDDLLEHSLMGRVEYADRSALGEVVRSMHPHSLMSAHRAGAPHPNGSVWGPRCAPPPYTYSHLPHTLQVLPILMEACGAPDADLRQCSVYGLGVLASKYVGAGPEGCWRESEVGAVCP